MKTIERVARTPGLWRIDANTSPAAGRAIEARAFDGSWRYVVERVRGGSPEQAEANARLIAAAPELLAACQRMLACHQAGMDAAQSSASTFVEKRCECGACDEARAAVAKAEGR